MPLLLDNVRTKGGFENGVALNEGFREFLIENLFHYLHDYYSSYFILVGNETTDQATGKLEEILGFTLPRKVREKVLGAIHEKQEGRNPKIFTPDFLNDTKDELGMESDEDRPLVCPDTQRKYEELEKERQELRQMEIHIMVPNPSEDMLEVLGKIDFRSLLHDDRDLNHDGTMAMQGFEESVISAYRKKLAGNFEDEVSINISGHHGLARDTLAAGFVIEAALQKQKDGYYVCYLTFQRKAQNDDAGTPQRWSLFKYENDSLAEVGSYAGDRRVTFDE